MMKWSEIKKNKPKGSIQDMINTIIKQKNENKKNGTDYANQRAKEDELKQKMEKRKERAIAKRQLLETESKDSYLSIGQYQFLQKNIDMAGKRLKE